MTDLRRMRVLCGLRQIDVWAGTGIPLYRLSLAERRGVRLSEPEEKLLRRFLSERWAALQALERQDRASLGASSGTVDFCSTQKRAAHSGDERAAD
jgi:hypothetical protein